MTERSMIETLEHKEKHDEFEEQNILMAEHFIKKMLGRAL